MADDLIATVRKSRREDGKKFLGRGIFQCTGRANYTAYGKRLGVDLLKEPERAADPDISVRIAVLYWNDKGLADQVSSWCSLSYRWVRGSPAPSGGVTGCRVSVVPVPPFGMGHER